MVSKAYFELDGVKYYGYDIYINIPYNNRRNLPKYCINSEVYSKLHTGSLLDNTIHPANGSEIYMASACSIPAEDIRACYNIKKTIDTGDYNVFDPTSLRKMYIYIKGVVISSSSKCIFADSVYRTNDEMLSLAMNVFPNMKISDAIVTRKISSIIWLNDSKNNYQLLLDGILKKPCINANLLNITGSNKLTIDILWMTYMAAMESTFMLDYKRHMANFIIQLNVINQCNWVDFPGTMAILNEIITVTTPGRRIQRNRSSFSKVVCRIIPADKPVAEFKNDEDRRLAQEFIARVLGLPEDTMFMSMSKLRELLITKHLTLNMFNRVYDTTVRIKKRKWESAE